MGSRIKMSLDIYIDVSNHLKSQAGWKDWNLMRKSKQEAAESRRRIVKAAAAKFRLNGIGGTGLSDLMAAAGLTHGGFYRHFASKDQLVAEACAAATESAMATFFSNKSPKNGLKGQVAKYLSPAHRDDPSAGCPLAALGSEIVRCDEKTRAAATQAFLELVNIIAAESGKTRPDVARRRALVAAATMIGALTMSRIVTDSELSASILREATKHLVD
jgi:TetR/AcrR family transcriptional regulator, transcriptional repressor for nem operon